MPTNASVECGYEWFQSSVEIRGMKERCVKDNTQRCGITTESVLSRQWQWADQQGCPISTPRKRCQSSKINSAVAKKSVPTRLWHEIIVEQ